MTSTRTQTLADLVAWTRPINELIDEVQRLPWDSEEELVDIGPADVARALGGFLGGTVSAAQVELWAGAIEGREDIAFEPVEVIDVIAELATPESIDPLTRERAEELLRMLGYS